MPTRSYDVAGVQVNLPSGSTLLAITPILVVILGIVVFSLVDLVRARSVRYLPKLVWGVIIILVSTPLGAIAYLVFGRPRRSGVSQPATTAAVAPDNDRARPTGGTAVSSPVHAITGPGTSTKASRADDTDPTVVQTVGLTRDYGGGGLYDVDLSVPRGCVYGLVGPNGAGKTTMLSILSGMRRADRGVVRVSVPRNRIAVCPDVPEFDSWLTAGEVVDLARSLVGPEPAGSSVTEALGLAGLGDVADRVVGEFSRGMTQRLGLACALVSDPQLLFLDEPTSALDPAGRAELLDLVSGMRGRRTVIFSSHILADVQRVADQVGILREGRLLYQGPTQALIDTHLQPRWLVRVAGDPALLRAELGSQPWVTRVEPVGPDGLRIEASSMELGERGIPVALSTCRQRLISCEPVAADLEAAFLALTTTR
jgi:ABC-2 type transport system ATP-binding protein